MSCGVCHRHCSDPELLWLWCGLAATAPIRPLAWEPLYAAGAALEKTKRQKKKGVIGVPIAAYQVKNSTSIHHLTNGFSWSSRRGAAETNPTRNHEVVGSIPGLA